MEVKKVYKEEMPPVKLIGKRYTNNDRDETGTFARYWQQWFADDNPIMLAQCKVPSNIETDNIGAMRMLGGDPSGFEYWIGIFCSPEAEVPEGFESVELPAGDIGVCWLYGNDQSGELYSMEASDMSMAAIKDQGWEYDEEGWFFERYNDPRFTEPDEEGNVILDICAYLTE